MNNRTGRTIYTAPTPSPRTPFVPNVPVTAQVRRSPVDPRQAQSVARIVSGR